MSSPAWVTALVCVLAMSRGVAARTTTTHPASTTTTTDTTFPSITTTTASDETTTTSTASPTTTTTVTTTLVAITTTTFIVPTTTTLVIPTTTTITFIGTSSTTTTTTTLGGPSSTTPTTLPPPRPCVPDDPAACDDGDPCTGDVCDAVSLTCLHVPLDGVPCADDGVFCTEDRCVAGVCEHAPLDLRCDDGACVMRACEPANPRADRAGCVLLRGRVKANGTPCTDDGFSCTDDACMRGICLHVPVDDRCVPPGECVAAACAPADPHSDTAGCTPGTARAEGEECAEDGDACSRDVCRGGTCRHEPEPDQAGCSPVQGAYQRTRALGTLTQEIGMEVPPATSPLLDGVLERLARIQAQLAAAADALAGRGGGVTPALAPRTAASSGIPADQRARIAFTIVLRTPREVASFLQTLADAEARQALGRPAVRHLRRQGRVLQRSTRRLRAELRLLARG